jgi:predicted TIM-barrel fold metal-dependent hydrolase
MRVASMIDFHVHLGNIARARRYERYSLTPQQLVERMDREGIEISVLLPLESPEAYNAYFRTEEAIAARDMYPERLIAFMSIDPRTWDVPEQIDMFVEDYGCRGFGEVKNGLSFDDPRMEVIYEKCDEHRLPIVFHSDPTLCHDEVGLPALERMLGKYPNATFCGHGPGFWSALSGDDDRAGGLPSGPVAPGGAIDRLMAEHENLYGIFDAGSGYNAMTRDPGFTLGFIERSHTRLLFGTDYLRGYQKLPQVDWLADVDIEPQHRELLARGNAMRLLGIE